MYQLEMKKVTYNNFKVGLKEFRPNIKFYLVSCDDALEQLGFCNSAPCVVNVDITQEERNTLIDDLLQLEIDLFSKYDIPDKSDPLYIDYEKYSWMWWLFENAISVD